MTERPPVVRTRDRRAAWRHGHRAEWRAAALLALKGYRILGRRVQMPAIEIDLVARRGDTIAFVEVKARDTTDAALMAVTPAVQRRIVRGAQQWLARNPRHAGKTLRFDIVTVAPFGWPRHLANAFDASGLLA